MAVGAGPLKPDPDVLVGLSVAEHHAAAMDAQSFIDDRREAGPIWRLKVRFPETVRVPLMGVRKDLQETVFGPGIAMTLIHAASAPAIRRGVVSGELSWILEQNAGMRSIIERLGGTVSKRYRLYRKDLCVA